MPTKTPARAKSGAKTKAKSSPAKTNKPKAKAIRAAFVNAAAGPVAAGPMAAVNNAPANSGKVSNENLKQNANAWAHQIGNGQTFEATDCVINQGGYVKAIGAKSVKLTRVHSTGQPDGGGVYFALCATDPVESFTWDNTGLKHEIVNGAEAGLRVMGGAKNVTLTNVNFRCRKWKDSKGRVDWWKQVQQWRDVRKALVTGGRTIGPIDIGEQKGTALTPQRVDELKFVNHSMTHKPSVTDRKTIGTVTMTGCPKIDETGKKIGMWPDGPI